MKKKKPKFNDYCLLLCDFELRRIDELKRTLKKAAKEYSNVHRVLKLGTNEERDTIIRDYPEFRKSYDSFDDEMEKYEKQIEEQHLLNEETLGVINETIKTETD